MGRTVYVPSLPAWGCVFTLSVWSIIYDFGGFRELQIFLPHAKGEKVILLGYPLFLHRTPANLLIYGDIILICVWTVFQAASFANLAPFALAGPGAAPPPHHQISHCSTVAVCTVALLSQFSRPWLQIPFQCRMWVDYFGFKIIPINATSMAEESKKFWRVNCIFYILLSKVLGKNSVDLIQPPLSRRNRRPIYLCYLLWQN